MCEIACVVLCGGKSSRMGRDKALLPFGNKDLAHFMYDAYSNIFPHTLLCCKTPKPQLKLPMIIESSTQHNHNTHTNATKDMAFSPLYGIACALQNLTGDYIAFVSVDTPFLKPQTLQNLAKQVQDLGANGGYIVQVDETNAIVREHFLLSVWHKNTLDSLHYAIQTQNFRVGELVKHLGFLTYNVYDTLLSYNLNTPQDYQLALTQLHSQHICDNI